jgi:hypothetical protein
MDLEDTGIREQHILHRVPCPKFSDSDKRTSLIIIIIIIIILIIIIIIIERHQRHYTSSFDNPAVYLKAGRFTTHLMFLGS